MRWNIVLGALVASSVVNAAAVSKGSPLVPTTVETPAVAAIEAVVPHGPHQPHLVRKWFEFSNIFRWFRPSESEPAEEKDTGNVWKKINPEDPENGPSIDELLAEFYEDPGEYKKPKFDPTLFGHPPYEDFDTAFGGLAGEVYEDLVVTDEAPIEHLPIAAVKVLAEGYRGTEKPPAPEITPGPDTETDFDDEEDVNLAHLTERRYGDARARLFSYTNPYPPNTILPKVDPYMAAYLEVSEEPSSTIGKSQATPNGLLQAPTGPFSIAADLIALDEILDAPTASITGFPQETAELSLTTSSDPSALAPPAPTYTEPTQEEFNARIVTLTQISNLLNSAIEPYLDTPEKVDQLFENYRTRPNYYYDDKNGNREFPPHALTTFFVYYNVKTEEICNANAPFSSYPEHKNLRIGFLYTDGTDAGFGVAYGGTVVDIPYFGLDKFWSMNDSVNGKISTERVSTSEQFEPAKPSSNCSSTSYSMTTDTGGVESVTIASIEAIVSAFETEVVDAFEVSYQDSYSTPAYEAPYMDSIAVTYPTISPVAVYNNFSTSTFEESQMSQPYATVSNAPVSSIVSVEEYYPSESSSAVDGPDSQYNYHDDYYYEGPDSFEEGPDSLKSPYFGEGSDSLKNVTSTSIAVEAYTITSSYSNTEAPAVSMPSKSIEDSSTAALESEQLSTAVAYGNSSSAVFESEHLSATIAPAKTSSTVALESKTLSTTTFQAKSSAVVPKSTMSASFPAKSQDPMASVEGLRSGVSGAVNIFLENLERTMSKMREEVRESNSKSLAQKTARKTAVSVAHTSSSTPAPVTSVYVAHTSSAMPAPATSVSAAHMSSSTPTPAAPNSSVGPYDSLVSSFVGSSTPIPTPQAVTSSHYSVKHTAAIEQYEGDRHQQDGEDLWRMRHPDYDVTDDFSDDDIYQTIGMGDMGYHTDTEYEDDDYTHESMEDMGYLSDQEEDEDEDDWNPADMDAIPYEQWAKKVSPFGDAIPSPSARTDSERYSDMVTSTFPHPMITSRSRKPLYTTRHHWTHTPKHIHPDNPWGATCPVYRDVVIYDDDPEAVVSCKLEQIKASEASYATGTSASPFTTPSSDAALPTSPAVPTRQQRHDYGYHHDDGPDSQHISHHDDGSYFDDGPDSLKKATSTSITVEASTAVSIPMTTGVPSTVPMSKDTAYDLDSNAESDAELYSDAELDSSAEFDSEPEFDSDAEFESDVDADSDDEYDSDADFDFESSSDWARQTSTSMADSKPMPSAEASSSDWARQTSTPMANSKPLPSAEAESEELPATKAIVDRLPTSTSEASSSSSTIAEADKPSMTITQYTPHTTVITRGRTRPTLYNAPDYRFRSRHHWHKGMFNDGRGGLLNPATYYWKDDHYRDHESGKLYGPDDDYEEPLDESLNYMINGQLYDERGRELDKKRYDYTRPAIYNDVRERVLEEGQEWNTEPPKKKFAEPTAAPQSVQPEEEVNPTQSKQEETPMQTMWQEEIPTQSKQEETPMQTMWQEVTRTQSKQEEFPTQPKQEEIPMQTMWQEEISTQSKQEETPMQSKQEETPMQTMWQEETPVQPEEEETPVQPKQEVTPVWPKQEETLSHSGDLQWARQVSPPQVPPPQAPYYDYSPNPYQHPPPFNQPYGQYHHPYNSNRYGGNQYGGNPYGGNSYGSHPYDSNPYGSHPYDSDPYGSHQYGGNQYGGNQYGSNQYGSNQYGNNQYGNNQYGNNQYGNNQYGNNPYANQPAYQPRQSYRQPVAHPNWQDPYYNTCGEQRVVYDDRREYCFNDHFLCPRGKFICHDDTRCHYTGNRDLSHGTVKGLIDRMCNR